MILLIDFFKILSVEKSGGRHNIAIELNPLHKIFNGHFPGQPVVPGVCMVQMLKEILEHLFGKPFAMKQASQLKFLSILDPNKVRNLDVEISVLKEDADDLKISGTFQKGELIFLKYKGNFVSQL